MCAGTKITGFALYNNVVRTFSEEVFEQTAAECGSAGGQLLLPHRERCLRVPTQTDREQPQVTERPHRSAEPRSVCRGLIQSGQLNITGEDANLTLQTDNVN